MNKRFRREPRHISGPYPVSLLESRGLKIDETNLRYRFRHTDCDRPVRGACVWRTGRRTCFPAGLHHGLRPYRPETLDHHGRCGSADRRGRRWVGSSSTRQSIRHRVWATRSRRGPGGGANRSEQWLAESGPRQRRSRHGQRSSRWRSGVRVGDNSFGPRRTGLVPIRPHRLRARADDVSCASVSSPVESFEPYRRRLLGLAYRMLGSMADAEDAVQETYLRWHGAADRDRVSDPRAFLMTTTTRICLDMLTSARARREQYVGPWLPEPVLDTAALAPDSRSELAEDLSIALLLILDQMSPLERAAFLLHDVFDFS